MSVQADRTLNDAFRLLGLASLFLGVACGGRSSRTDSSSPSPDANATSACPLPTSAIPVVAPFQPPSDTPLGTFQVTFHNLCAQTLWPAWGSSGGLDNSIIDTELWFPLEAMSDRTVTVYGGVREIGFWGRSGCSFDDAGGGSCQTGDCGGFVCPIVVNAFPTNATVFALEEGFLDGYNVPLRVESAACGTHECVADLSACSHASVTEDACGTTLGCSNVCDETTSECCRQPPDGCAASPPNPDSDPGNLVLTFCP